MRLTTLLPGRLGFGTAPLGNMFRAIPDDEVQATLQAAWDQGVRYYDTAPFYGAGLAELRLGELLSRRPRDTYVLSTKVGRVVLDEVEDPAARELGEKGGLFAHGRPNRMVDDYSADATLRSVEDSLGRLGTDRLDIVWVHDIAQDFHGDNWLHHFETARTGAFRVLSKLRDEGVIGAWGLGVNRAEPDRTHPRPGRTPSRRLPPRGPLHPPRPRPRPPAPAAHGGRARRGDGRRRPLQLRRPRRGCALRVPGRLARDRRAGPPHPRDRRAARRQRQGGGPPVLPRPPRLGRRHPRRHPALAHRRGRGRAPGGRPHRVLGRPARLRPGQRRRPAPRLTVHQLSPVRRPPWHPPP
ncbi:oxidoreductase [Streptomyces sp. PVA_94-07]|nr:oxidoreductase [Streptomyces sp. PVA_94-07]